MDQRRAGLRLAPLGCRTVSATRWGSGPVCGCGSGWRGFADLLFEADEWRTAYILNKKRPPKETPPLNAVVKLIAPLGGFLGRKGDGEPGAKMLWLGLRGIAVCVEGMRFARELLLHDVCKGLLLPAKPTPSPATAHDFGLYDVVVSQDKPMLPFI